MILKTPKISDIIKSLQEALETYGDIPVTSSEPGGYWACKDIEIDVHVDGKTLIIEGASKE